MVSCDLSYVADKRRLSLPPSLPATGDRAADRLDHAPQDRWRPWPEEKRELMIYGVRGDGRTLWEGKQGNPHAALMAKPRGRHGWGHGACVLHPWPICRPAGGVNGFRWRGRLRACSPGDGYHHRRTSCLPGSSPSLGYGHRYQVL